VKLRSIGLSIFLSTQLLAPTPVRAAPLPLAFLDSGILSNLLSLMIPSLQGLASDLLEGLSIGGIDLSSLVMNVVFSSNGLLKGGLMSGVMTDALREALEDTLSRLPAGDQLYSTIVGLLDGSISLQSLLNSGTLQSILAEILGNNSDSETNPTNDTTIGDNGVLGTGSVTCLYASTCRPNSNPYQSIFTQASGVQGYPNPNEVRGKIYQAATSGKILSDIYAPNASVGGYYAGNQSDRDINRATTETFLSKAGQAQQKKISDNSTKTVEGVAELVKKCSEQAKSSQELIRCNLLVNSVGPSFDAAQLSVLMGMRQDDQFQKIQLGNISASMDAERRQRDVENAGLSISSLKAIWTTPTKW